MDIFSLERNHLSIECRFFEDKECCCQRFSRRRWVPDDHIWSIFIFNRSTLQNHCIKLVLQDPCLSLQCIVLRNKCLSKLLCPTLLLAIFLKPGESDSICQKLHKIISAAVKFIDLSPIIYDFVPTKSWKKTMTTYFFFRKALCMVWLLSVVLALPWVWTNVKNLPIKISFLFCLHCHCCLGSWQM